MHDVVRMSSAKLKELFALTAKQMSVSPGIVEKDFWVVWTLDYLFARSPWKTQLAFKGGTSLSKAFGLIRRFSEDIDLILDWRCVTDEDPLRPRSNTKQDSFNKSVQENSGRYISGALRSMIDTAMDGECSVVVDDNDDHVLLLQYSLTFRSSYIIPHIRLEIGPLAAWQPNRESPILPYVAEVFPQLKIAPVSVPTIIAERTFWEKVTILHQEHHRQYDYGLDDQKANHS